MKVNADNTIEHLINLGYTKQQIADFIGVRWCTVNNWHKDHYDINARHVPKLKEMFIKGKKEGVK